ncbi:MAG: TolC family protein, partial [Bacilli bacterium]
MEDCIAKGLQNNPMIQSSQLFVEENQTKVDEARSGYYPKVSLNSNATTYSNNNGDQRFENYNTGISASYNLFNGFRTKAGYHAARDHHEAAFLQHESVQQDLVLDITFAYYKTLQAERILKSAEEAVKNSQLHLDFAHARNMAGMATRSDILKSEVELSNAELEKIKAANALLAAKGNLNKLMGLPANHPTEIIDDLSELNETPVQSYDSLFAEAMESRVEVKRFYSLLNAQQNNIQLARGEYYPSLDVNANYNFSGEKISGMRENWWLG